MSLKEKTSNEQLRDTIAQEQIRREQLLNQKKKGSKLEKVFKVGGKVLKGLEKM